MIGGVFTELPWGNLSKLNKAGQEFALPSLIQGEKGAEVFSDKEFSSFLTEKLDEVSGLINSSQTKLEAFLIDPNSIDPHDVTISMAQANMSVSMTKQVVDASIRAYREIINIR